MKAATPKRIAATPRSTNIHQCRASLASIPLSRFQARDTGSRAGCLLMVSQRHVSEPIPHRGLRRPQHPPVGAIELHLLIELLRQREGGLVHLGEAVEFALKGEFAGKGLFERPAAPYGDGGLAVVAVAEVNLADGVLDFLDRHVVDQRDLRIRPHVHFLQRREDGSDILDAAIEDDLGRREHTSVRIDAAHPAELLTVEQELLLELNLLVSGGKRPHVHGGGILQVGASVLDREFVIGARPSIVVERSFPENEMIVVKVEVGSVVEENLADLAVEGVVIDIDLEIEFLDGLIDGLPELHEAFLAGEAVGLKQDLVLAIVDYIVGEVPGIGMLAYVLVHCAQSRKRIIARNSSSCGASGRKTARRHRFRRRADRMLDSRARGGSRWNIKSRRGVFRSGTSPSITRPRAKVFPSSFFTASAGTIFRGGSRCRTSCDGTDASRWISEALGCRRIPRGCSTAPTPKTSPACSTISGSTDAR